MGPAYNDFGYYEQSATEGFIHRVPLTTSSAATNNQPQKGLYTESRLQRVRLLRTISHRWVYTPSPAYNEFGCYEQSATDGFIHRVPLTTSSATTNNQPQMGLYTESRLQRVRLLRTISHRWVYTPSPAYNEFGCYEQSATDGFIHRVPLTTSSATTNNQPQMGLYTESRLQRVRLPRTICHRRVYTPSPAYNEFGFHEQSATDGFVYTLSPAYNEFGYYEQSATDRFIH